MAEKQTRRRGAALERIILEAAWQELSERGWAGFTVDGVASRSGAAKSVLYRRWGNKVELVVLGDEPDERFRRTQTTKGPHQ